MNPPFMDIAEFRRIGLLQEINRLILHPLGLAMAVDMDDDGTETLLGVYDNRQDPEGWYFAGLTADEVARGEALQELRDKRAPARIAALGYVIQPLVVEDGAE